MTESSDEEQDLIEYLDPAGDRSCQHTKIYYRITVSSTLNQGRQIDNETQDSTGVVDTDSTGIGATGEVGLSNLLPKGVLKGSAKKQWSIEYTDTESDVDRRSASVSEGFSIEYEVVNPNNVDLHDPNVISGCRNTSNDGADESRCKNNIQIMMSNYVNNVIGDSKDIRSDVSEIASETSLPELEDSEASKKGIVGHSVAKARESAGTAVSTARSGASSAITRSRDGVSTSVQRVKQWYGSDDVAPEQPSDLAPSSDPEIPETTIRVSPGDTDPEVSYTNGDLTMMFHDGVDTDTTVLYVAAAGDERVPISSTDGDFTTTLTDGAMQLSPRTDAAVPMSPGTDGEVSFSISDGSTVHVTPGDEDTDVVPRTNGDFYMAFDASQGRDGPTTEHDDARSTTQDTGPTESQESELPEETGVSERSGQDKRKHRLENVLASNGAESELSEDPDGNGRSTQDSQTQDVDQRTGSTEQETDREDHPEGIAHDEEHDDRERA